MYTHRNRKTKNIRPASILPLSLLLISGTVNAFLLPPGFASSRSSVQSSSSASSGSTRPSLNFGTHLPQSLYAVDARGEASGRFNPTLADFNDRVQAVAFDSLDESQGRTLAKAFVHHLHPGSSFHITSSYASSHNGILHVHFRQEAPLASGAGGEHAMIPISDALINVNLDLGTGKIVSFGDSFWSGNQAAANEGSGKSCATLQEEIGHKVLASIGDRILDNDNAPQAQIVFGTADDAETIDSVSDSDLTDLLDCISGSSSKKHPKYNPSSRTSSPADPRLPLLTFLRQAYSHSNPRSALAEARIFSDLGPLIDPKADLEQIASQIWIEHDLVPTSAVEGESRGDKQMVMKLHNVPGAEEPVKMRLHYAQRPTLSGETKLVLTYGIEYRSLQNWYEAYVHAEEGNVAKDDGKDSIVWVVDWMKDFRPTDGNGALGQASASLRRPRLGLKEKFWAFIFGPSSRLETPCPHHLSKHDPPTPPPSPPDNPPEVPGPDPHLPNPPAKGPYYRVFPWGTNDPEEGKRKLLARPFDADSSERGWHIVPPTIEKVGAHRDWTDEERHDWTSREGWSDKTQYGARFHDTRSNNVFAAENWSGGSSFEMNYRPSGYRVSNATDSSGSASNARSPNTVPANFTVHDLAFDFPLGWGPKENRTGKDINPRSYIDASITELFFTCNEVHDLFYRYGFDEVSGNFQEHNFGRGGLGSDAVIANAQDGSGMDNANFATPPDGQRPRMRMYVWDGPKPWRDGDLEAGIVIHEFAHGISTRLTGGPANSGCLGWGEAGGMGEGWGDWFATMIRMHASLPEDYSMGEWASGRIGGIRKYRYSMNMTVNPETYSVLDKPGYWGVHAIGEVWAEMLYVVAENLIAKYGWSKTLFPPVHVNGTIDADHTFFKRSEVTGKLVPRDGNTLILQLVVDGMKLQPCRPGFFDARDAILQADKILTGGENACEIWNGFASRGLGPDASIRGQTPWGGGIRKEDYSIPHSCKGHKGKGFF